MAISVNLRLSVILTLSLLSLVVIFVDRNEEFRIHHPDLTNTLGIVPGPVCPCNILLRKYECDGQRIKRWFHWMIVDYSNI